MPGGVTAAAERPDTIVLLPGRAEGVRPTDGDDVRIDRRIRHLAGGVTTVRDLGEIGGAADAIFSLRNAVAKGYVPGPRIFAAGSIISPTGGHGVACGYREDINLLLDANGRGAINCT